MRVIIQKWDGEVYAYVETEKQFKKNERHRPGIKITREDLADDCNLASYPLNCHISFKVKK